MENSLPMSCKKEEYDDIDAREVEKKKCVSSVWSSRRDMSERMGMLLSGF